MKLVKNMLGVGLIALGAILFIGIFAGGDSPADMERGQHCLSPWDGSHYEFTRKLKSKLKDPDSYEHVKTDIYVRGKDGFAGNNSGISG